jgi:hypothetical protein
MERLIQPPFYSGTDRTETKRLEIGSIIMISHDTLDDRLTCLNVSPGIDTTPVFTPIPLFVHQYAFRVKKVYTGKEREERKERFEKLTTFRRGTILFKWRYPDMAHFIDLVDIGIIPFDLYRFKF